MAPPPAPNPAFEAFVVWLSRDASPSDVEALVAPVLGEGWTVTPIESDPGAFELTPTAAPPSEAEAWEASYRLRELDGVEDAEPLFAVAVYEEVRDAEAPRGPGLEAAEGKADDKAGTERANWALEQIRVPEAINAFFGGDPDRAGAGVVVGHPDTGYHRHPEILDRLLIDKGYDFVRDDPDALDDLRPSSTVLIEHPSHGVSTSSVIVSGWTDQPPTGNATGVQGVAPGARLIPIRATRTVILVSMRNLARAIEFAVDQGAHVISMSLGGVPSRRLYEAVRYAERNGVVVCAAAGNKVRFTVWPANYDEVVACAACSIERTPWAGSSRGKAVNVTAPGESVWRARVERKEHSDDVTFIHGRGAGTSYAVAHVAGAAALWLSHHGRAALLDRYGPAKLPGVFRELVAATCRKERGLGDRFGAGLLDVHALLAHPLPATGGLEALAPAPPAPEPELDVLFDVGAGGGLEAVGGRPTDEGLRRALADVVGADGPSLDAALEEVGDELLFHLMTRPEDFDRVREAARPSGGGLEAAGPSPEAAAVRADLLSADRSERLRRVVAR